METGKTTVNKIKRRSFSIDEKEEILKKTNGKCAHCGKSLKHYEMTIEHILPIAKGGNHSEFNIVGLCEHCNFEKSNMIYNIRDFYKYIDAEYVEQFENELFMSMKPVINRYKRMMAEDVRLYQCVNPAYMQMVFQASIRSKKNSFELFKKTLINIRYELAYEAEADEIFKFVAKNREKNGRDNTMYDNVYKIRELIKYGQVYTLRSPDKTIRGVVGMFNIARHNIEMPIQIQNLAEAEELAVLHLITIYELTDNLNMCEAMIMYDLLRDFRLCDTKLITFNSDNSINDLMRFSSKIFNIPFNFRGFDGYIQCYTGSGEREVVEKFVKAESEDDDSIEIDKDTLRIIF